MIICFSMKIFFPKSVPNTPPIRFIGQHRHPRTAALTIPVTKMSATCIIGRCGTAVFLLKNIANIISVIALSSVLNPSQ